MIESFVMYRSFHEALKKLSREEYGNVMYAINEYAINDIEPQDLSPVENAIFIMAKPKIQAGLKIVKNKHDRNCREYKEWRKQVFQRDNYTCQFCGVRGGRLNAHHIKAFSKDIKNRFNTKNGITLCYNCHKNLHKRERG